MSPHLTKRGKAALATGLIWLAVGAGLLLTGKAWAAWPVVVAACGLFAALILAFFAAIPLARIFEEGLFELSLEVPDSTSLFTHRDTELTLQLRNLSGRSLSTLTLRPELATSLKASTDLLPDVELPPSSEATLKMAIEARRSGRWFVHGFHLSCLDATGLFSARNYIPSPLALTFLPLGLIDRSMRSLKPAQRVHQRVGTHPVRQRGFSADLREIRDHQHGDPFRSIAWKATARLGKLMVREFESEISLSAYLVLDISATMRGVSASMGKLEHAIRLANHFASAVMRGNDRCGLLSFDERVFGHLPPNEGALHMRRLTQHLIGVSNIVNDQMTEYDEDEVIEVLIRYLMLQRRLDFRRRKVPRRGLPLSVEDIYDVQLLNRWLLQELKGTEEKARPLRAGVLGYDNLSLARRYCHLHGVELPFRSELRYGTKERGLKQALEVIMRESRTPHFILILSDLAGFVDLHSIVDVLRLAHRRHHKIGVLAPFTPSYLPTSSDDPQHNALHEIFSAAELREREAVLRALQTSGVPIVEVSPDQHLSTLLRRLKLFR